MVATDAEKDPVGAKAQHARSIPYWRQVLDQGAVTQEIAQFDYPGSGTEQDPYVVSWIPNDPRNPMLLQTWRKVTITLVVSMATFAVAIASSCYSGAIKQVVEDLHVDNELATLGLSLFVLGFALGPLFWAPLSEFVGRQYPFAVSFGAMTAFLAGCAGAPNIQTLLVLRFLAGAAGSAPLTNAGGVISDMFRAEHRGLALSLFAAAPWLGPVLGPFMGGFLGMNAGWQWVEGFLAVFSALMWVIMACCVPETYAPVLLRRRAERLSQITGKVYRTKLDIEHGARMSVKRMFGLSLLRPWVLLFREPIVLLLSIYIAIIYGALFMMFAAFPIVYQEGRGWNQGVGGLAFFGIMVGMILATLYSIPDNKRYQNTQKRHGGFAPQKPAYRPVAGGAPFGFGVLLIYLGIMSYLIDSYTLFAASVLAANSVTRSFFGAVFPLFTTYMYDSLGIHWASSVPAFLTVGCLPFPFIFYKYGEQIRKRCKYAAQSAMYSLKLQQTASRS
ncbi:bicyclomycin resistance protein [Aspergillus campestris IBT 28561]|uniref:Bicyclomycin resistance protein n=1 Tax=Aspergillus campestris (strain IBT 28561) TaxID=1392248 RepID=A0A2I1CTX5_ASPC2|nr:bicyclomycin resistance protein [Aspergillus campestris IBT 28561]PKY01082.1 bicyclomycin resistance protein [Aspergillus campestris IBT 28561]